MKPDVQTGITLERYDERYLECSWSWLRDPEIRRLTMTPEFTREQQARWFASLPTLRDYRIWGIAHEGRPIGALGLKHITAADAEYWGYLGDKSCWGRGLGRDMMHFAIEEARRLGLARLYLKVHRDNPRAIALYARSGFSITGEQDGVLRMDLDLTHAR